MRKWLDRLFWPVYGSDEAFQLAPARWWSIPQRASAKAIARIFSGYTTTDVLDAYDLYVETTPFRGRVDKFMLERALSVNPGVTRALVVDTRCPTCGSPEKPAVGSAAIGEESYDVACGTCGCLVQIRVPLKAFDHGEPGNGWTGDDCGAIVDQVHEEINGTPVA